MRYIRQLGIIFAVTCVAEIMKYFIPLPIPASIYGLVLMFALLVSGLVKLEQVKDVADFLIEIMPMMFIVPGVGLLQNWSALRPILVPVAVITVATTVLVMGITGRTAQGILGRQATKANAAASGQSNFGQSSGEILQNAAETENAERGRNKA